MFDAHVFGAHRFLQLLAVVNVQRRHHATSLVGNMAPQAANQVKQVRQPGVHRS